MKIFKKRVIAYIIDVFLMVGVSVAFDEFLYSFGLGFLEFDFLIAVVFLVFKDCIFLNRSLGKRIVGLVVYDSNWKTPKFIHSLKRTVGTYFYIPVWTRKRIYINSSDTEERKEKMTFFLWEKNVLKSFVIDKKVYKKLKADAEGMDGNFADNMTELYMMYLRDIYSK